MFAISHQATVTVLEQTSLADALARAKDIPHWEMHRVA